MVSLNQLRQSPDSSEDEDDIERSGFEDEEVEDTAPLLVISPARWSQPQPLQLNFLSLNDADSPVQPHGQQIQYPPHAPANYLPHEILLHIFRLLANPRDLYSTLLVSRPWCQCSVELLWHKPQFANLVSVFKLINMLGKSDLIFPYATFIRRLNFTMLGNNLNDQTFNRLTACVRLERLTLYGCNVLSDEALEGVLKCCPHLVALDLTGVVDTSDASITTVAATAPRLQGINLGGCRKVSDVGITALATSCLGLRRIKLSGLESLTDAPIVLLSKNCKLLLELDLHNCPLVTDECVRELWLHSTYLRELRLALCGGLTEMAFPIPPTPLTAYSAAVGAGSAVNAFPNSSALTTTGMAASQSGGGGGGGANGASGGGAELQPLILNRVFDHLRMLDLTGCANLTDAAIDGIVTNCSKIRNLVLAKCSGLTDEAVGSIAKLGRHLHYLHLGHVAFITDRAVTRLARACTRLRYIDLACCPQLTDMSVFELAVLPKLRRIGLVRVLNLTDQAVYSLGDRQITLERIHLSYCENISVSAIHYLLQRLPRLTHLSLTGIPAFRRHELQQFCRTPPKEFTQNQRAAFCVYSGRGVNELRRYLDLLYHSLTDASPEPEESSTESDDDDDDVIRGDDEDDSVPPMPGAMPPTSHTSRRRDPPPRPRHAGGEGVPRPPGPMAQWDMPVLPSLRQSMRQGAQQIQQHLQRQQAQQEHERTQRRQYVRASSGVPGSQTMMTASNNHLVSIPQTANVPAGSTANPYHQQGQVYHHHPNGTAGYHHQNGTQGYAQQNGTQGQLHHHQGGNQAYYQQNPNSPTHLSQLPTYQLPPVVTATHAGNSTMGGHVGGSMMATHQGSPVLASLPPGYEYVRFGGGGRVDPASVDASEVAIVDVRMRGQRDDSGASSIEQQRSHSHGHLATSADGTSTLVYPIRPKLSAPGSSSSQHQPIHDLQEGGSMMDGGGGGSPGIPSHDRVISGSPSSPTNGIVQDDRYQTQQTSPFYPGTMVWGQPLPTPPRLPQNFTNANNHNTSPPPTSAALSGSPSSPEAYSRSSPAAMATRQWTTMSPWHVGGVASPSPSPSGSAAAFALGVPRSMNEVGEVGMVQSNEPSPPSSGLSSARRTPTVGDQTTVRSPAEREQSPPSPSPRGGDQNQNGDVSTTNARRSVPVRHGFNLFGARSGSNGSRERSGSPRGSRP